MEFNSANLLYFELRTDIGQYTQGQIDLMMSHINSYARKKLGGNLLQPSSQNIPPRGGIYSLQKTTRKFTFRSACNKTPKTTAYTYILTLILGISYMKSLFFCISVKFIFV